MDLPLFDNLRYFLETLECPSWMSEEDRINLEDVKHKYFMKEGRIYLKGTERMLLSVREYPQCFDMYHSHPLGGHFAFRNTFRKISRHYYWPTMKEDITRDVNCCPRCQTKGKEVVQEPLHPIPVLPTPFYMISMDIKHVSSSRADHKYIIVAIDYFSKWVEAKALVFANSIEVSCFLYEDVICRHSAPTIVITDNGTPFVNDLISKVCSGFYIEHRRTSKFHASANGQVERFNRTLGGGLRMLSNDEKDDWHLYLPGFLFAYRTMYQQTTRHTPFMMLYGREARTPFENYMLPKPQLKKLTKSELELEIQRIFVKTVQHMKSVHSSAAEFISKSQENQEIRIAKKIAGNKDKHKPPFSIGDLVMKYNDSVVHDLSKKLQDRYVGPYIVHKTYTNSTYLLKTQDGKEERGAVHGNKLKIYKAPNIFVNFPHNPFHHYYDNQQ